MESSDADELICPPPPVISKVSMSIGKSNKPTKVNCTTISDNHEKKTSKYHIIDYLKIAQPVQMKLAAPKPIEPVKKLTVASAFNNDDSSDDDDEEEAPVKYSRNIGR